MVPDLHKILFRSRKFLRDSLHYFTVLFNYYYFTFFTFMTSTRDVATPLKTLGESTYLITFYFYLNRNERK